AGVHQGQDQYVLAQNGRSRHADVIAHGGIIATERSVPEQIAARIEGDKVAAGEESINSFPIRDGRGGRHAGLVVAKGVGGGPELPLPKLLAGGGFIAKYMQSILLEP